MARAFRDMIIQVRSKATGDSGSIVRARASLRAFGPKDPVGDRVFVDLTPMAGGLGADVDLPNAPRVDFFVSVVTLAEGVEIQTTLQKDGCPSTFFDEKKDEPDSMTMRFSGRREVGC